MQVRRWVILFKLFLILVAVSLALKNTREQTEVEYAKIREYEMPHQVSPKFNKYDRKRRKSRATDVSKIREEILESTVCKKIWKIGQKGTLSQAFVDIFGGDRQTRHLQELTEISASCVCGYASFKCCWKQRKHNQEISDDG